VAEGTGAVQQGRNLLMDLGSLIHGYERGGLKITS